MTAVLPQRHVSAGAVPKLWQRVVRQLTWRHGLAVLLAALAITVADGAYLVEKIDKPGVFLVLAFNALVALVLFSFTLLGWIVAVESGTDFRLRWKLLAAIVISSTLTAGMLLPIAHAVDLHEVFMSLLDKKQYQAAAPDWLAILTNSAQYSVFAFFFIAAAEMLRRRSATQRAVQSAQREQAAIAREVLESRLTAMQAQVEPQFLFDSLVDIEALYRRDAGRAAEDLDRLITYLRVALPRLREPGSTIDAEIELVQAYLSVVTSLHNGRPALCVTLPDECRYARFYPMLLLPLLQRAVRHPSGTLPESIRIGISRIGDQLAIVLRFALPDHCDDDPELARVRERLAGLFGAAASLECQEISGITQLTMRIPAADCPAR